MTRHRLHRLLPLALGALCSPALASGPLIPRFEYGDFRLQAFGRVQGDALLSSGLPAERTTSVDLRRAGLGLLGRYGENWRARLSADVSDGVRLQDANVEYRGWPVWVEFGRILEPFGLADQSGGNSLPLMERPQATLIGASFGFGVGANMRGQRWALSASVVGQTGNGELDGGAEALTARGTFTPLRREGLLLHLGTGISLREPDGGTVRFAGTPETSLVSGLSVQSPRLTGVERVQIINGESALLSGPVLVAAEVFNAEVDRATGSSVGYGGGYVEASWAITGERRAYSTRLGVFDGVRPRRPLDIRRVWQGKGGYGAVEIAARYGVTDLTGPGNSGDESRIAGVGLNWIPVTNTRVHLNVLNIEEQRRTSRGVLITEDDTVVQTRVQFRF
jgi:phosphate-selective porin OprO/OprP